MPADISPLERQLLREANVGIDASDQYQESAMEGEWEDIPGSNRESINAVIAATEIQEAVEEVYCYQLGNGYR